MDVYITIRHIVEKKCRETGTEKKYWAQKCGYCEDIFGMMLRGSKRVMASDIIRLCEGLEVMPNDIFSDSAL